MFTIVGYSVDENIGKVEPTAQIVAPPGNIQHQVSYVLENKNGEEGQGHVSEDGNGADVTFEVDWQILSAPKCIPDARSRVFSSEFR
ncbi:hypothetical protein FCM35_KLT00164 [Carex littledalei]|uniref:Uncharacterized protein n=1 Tax=Carex littledalei TaxID=544730 RepID=A0A833RTF9_9POAL|nr:hypothetical protein FCM35_KLT00164 [Carex littledalei]